MTRTTTTLIVLLALLPGVALAQDRGSEADQQACTPDVFRLCADFIPDEGPILACLQAKRAQLSPACAPVIFPVSDRVITAAAPRTKRSHHKKHAHPSTK